MAKKYIVDILDIVINKLTDIKKSVGGKEGIVPSKYGMNTATSAAAYLGISPEDLKGLLSIEDEDFILDAMETLPAEIWTTEDTKKGIGKPFICPSCGKIHKFYDNITSYFCLDCRCYIDIKEASHSFSTTYFHESDQCLYCGNDANLCGCPNKDGDDFSPIEDQDQCFCGGCGDSCTCGNFEDDCDGFCSGKCICDGFSGWTTEKEEETFKCPECNDLIKLEDYVISYFCDNCRSHITITKTFDGYIKEWFHENDSCVECGNDSKICGCSDEENTFTGFHGGILKEEVYIDPEKEAKKFSGWYAGGWESN